MDDGLYLQYYTVAKLSHAVQFKSLHTTAFNATENKQKLLTTYSADSDEDKEDIFEISCKTAFPVCVCDIDKKRLLSSVGELGNNKIMENYIDMKNQLLASYNDNTPSDSNEWSSDTDNLVSDSSDLISLSMSAKVSQLDDETNKKEMVSFQEVRSKDNLSHNETFESNQLLSNNIDINTDNMVESGTESDYNLDQQSTVPESSIHDLPSVGHNSHSDIPDKTEPHENNINVLSDANHMLLSEQTVVNTVNNDYRSSQEEDNADSKIRLLTKSIDLDDKHHDIENVMEVNKGYVEGDSTQQSLIQNDENLQLQHEDDLPFKTFMTYDQIEKKNFSDSYISYTFGGVKTKGELLKGTTPNRNRPASNANRGCIPKLCGSQRSNSLTSNVKNNDAEKHHNNMIDGQSSEISCSSDELFFPRENKASIKRKEYIIKLMEKELEDAYKALSDKEKEVQTIIESKGEDGWDKVKEKEDEISDMRKELTELKVTNLKLQNDLADKATEFEQLHQQLEKVQKEFIEREQYHYDMYLKMYTKGQKAAQIEREEQIEEIAIQNPEGVSTSELLTKLEHMQKELGRWQTLARQESYDGADTPQTEASAMLRFMKDSMFHYLTDREGCGIHLRAIVRMLGFSEDEKNKMVELRRKLKRDSPSTF